MNYLTRSALSRRTFLQGVGAAIALPMLDAMTPALASAGRAAKAAPVRLVFAYVPNGIIMKDWTPKTVGADYEMTRILTPLKAYRDDLMVISGLADHNGNEPRRRPRRPRPRRRFVPHRRSLQKNGRLGHSRRHFGGSDCGAGVRFQNALRLAGNGL